MPLYVLSFVSFALVFGLMDFLWLSTAFKSIYQPAIGTLLAEKVRMGPAALFYVIYVAGVTYFVVAPAAATGDWRQALLRGAAFGLVAYATYDLTNQATMSIWPTRMSVIDMAWGTFATATAAAIAVLAASRAAKALGWS